MDQSHTGMDDAARERLQHILAVEPAFGRWLAAHNISEAMQTPAWNQRWAAEMFAEALLQGTTDTLQPFLDVIAVQAYEIARDSGSTPGWDFAYQLYQALNQTGAPFSGTTVLPDILRIALNDVIYQESRHDRWSYGKY